MSNKKHRFFSLSRSPSISLFSSLIATPSVSLVQYLSQISLARFLIFIQLLTLSSPPLSFFSFSLSHNLPRFLSQFCKVLLTRYLIYCSFSLILLFPPFLFLSRPSLYLSHSRSLFLPQELFYYLHPNSLNFSPSFSRSLYYTLSPSPRSLSSFSLSLPDSGSIKQGLWYLKNIIKTVLT